MDLLFFAFAGFLAQLVDGSLGMAYGVTCSTLLMTFGYPPAAASASVHLAEVVTSGVSGHFHRKLGNVDRALFWNLVWPGVIGGVIGAYLLSSLSADLVRPWVAAYLALMGLRILYKAWNVHSIVRRSSARFELLGFVGGLLDAMGGGGWGPIVTTTLVGRGHEPRLAIGSVNRAEFFVTLAQSFTFVFAIGIANLHVVGALCMGGVLAAPLGAHVANWVRGETLMALVGVLIVTLSLRTIIASIGLF